MNLERKEQILSTIDRLGVVSVKQLHDITRIGTYRHTCRVISLLDEYLNVVRSSHKIIYLNKEGRKLIGSEKEIKKSVLFDHMLLANDAYIYYKCPVDWKREYHIEVVEQKKEEFAFEIQVKGVTVAKKKIISDAVFSRDGYSYLVEIDNVRDMQDNKKKIERYKEMWSEIKRHFNAQPKLCIFTQSKKRKQDFIQMCGKLPSEVFTFDEIR